MIVNLMILTHSWSMILTHSWSVNSLYLADLAIIGELPIAFSVPFMSNDNLTVTQVAIYLVGILIN